MTSLPHIEFRGEWYVEWQSEMWQYCPLPEPAVITCSLLHECSCWIPVDTEEIRLGANQTLWNEAALSFPLPPPPRGTPNILQILCKANCPFSPETPSNNAAIVSAFQYVYPRTQQGKWRAFLQYTLKKLNNLLSLSYLHFCVKWSWTLFLLTFTSTYQISLFFVKPPGHHASNVQTT